MFKILTAALCIASCILIAPLQAASSDMIKSDVIADHEVLDDQASPLQDQDKALMTIPLAAEDAQTYMDAYFSNASVAETSAKHLRAAPALTAVIGQYITCNPATDSCTPGFVCCLGRLDIPIFKFTCRPANMFECPVPPSSCFPFEKVVSGDTCNIVIARRVASVPSLTLANLYALNPTVNNPSCNNLQIGQNLCLTSNAAASPAFVYIKSRLGGNICIAKTSTSNAITTRPCQPFTTQRFIIDGFQIKYAPDRKLCLDIPFSNAFNGAVLQLFTCNNSPAQRFFRYVTGEIRAIGTDISKCIDVPNSNTANGVPTTIFQVNSPLSNNQLWDFVAAV